jgi:hypothetical protein
MDGEFLLDHEAVIRGVAFAGVLFARTAAEAAAPRRQHRVKRLGLLPFTGSTRHYARRPLCLPQHPASVERP